MKKEFKILIAIILSILFTIISSDNITNNIELTIQILMTLLGLCITSYVFICSPISERLSICNKKDRDIGLKMINELEDDMKKIFLFSVLIIIVSIIQNIDYPLIKDVCIYNDLINIESIKMIIFNSILSCSFLLGMLGFYDFIYASFVIIKKLLFYFK